MDRKAKYKTLLVDIKLLGSNVSKSILTYPEHILQTEVTENKMLWSSEIPEAQINLTNSRDQDTNNISSWGNEGNLAWTKIQAPTLAEPLSMQ